VNRNSGFRLDREDFLANYWQRKPLLLRSAIEGFLPPISADELAGLAMEAEVESRIIERNGDDWHVIHGPFEEKEFRRETHWTLLVQAVDHYVPDVADLRRLVDFIPQWRVDDVMVSYAVDGGSVGPHYDNYDVFLLQGEGRRRWRVGQPCDANSPLHSHAELRMLREFDCAEEYLLEPGDMLYLPPGVAHWGVAEGECTTFSIGFRAPGIDELVSRYADHLLEQLPRESFYTDPGLAPGGRPGEIRAVDLAQVRKQLFDALGADGDMRWFGELVTEPRYEVAPHWDEETAKQLRDRSSTVLLDGAARLAFTERDGEVVVFANGGSRRFGPAAATAVSALCATGCLQGPALAETLDSLNGPGLLDYLLEAGCIHVD